MREGDHVGGFLHFEGTDVAAVAATDVGDTNRASEAGTALIGRRAAGIASVYGRAAGTQSLCLGRAAVVLQLPEQRIFGRGGDADLI